MGVGAADDFGSLPFARAVGRRREELRHQPLGAVLRPNAGFEPVQWLAEHPAPRVWPCCRCANDSVEGAFGLLVLSSPDPTRYTADMGTDFLARIGEIASAALSRLLPAR